MINNANPWDNLKFDLEGVAEVKRKFFGTLYNTYSFFALYANIDGFTGQEEQIPVSDRPELDRWILSELNTLIKEVDECFEQYDATRATRLISDFVQENLSNWYVRLGRRRFWKGSFGEDKLAAYQTLSLVLKITAQLIAPVAPFFAERLYRDLNGVESVHLSLFPTADTALIDKPLEEKMQLAQKVSSLVLSIRQKEKIKVRQPLQRVMIPVSKAVSKEALLAVSELIRSEVNVKEVSLLEDASDILVKEIKPNFKTLGPKYGPKMKQVAFSITSLNQEQIQQFEQEEAFSISLDDSTIELSLEDVFITNKDIEGWLVASHGALTVALDITLNETLINEGIARELVNRIQNLRKDSGLEVTDKILLYIGATDKVNRAVSSNRDYLMQETLCEQLELVEGLEKGIAVNFDDIETQLYLQKK
jgi:isoleucyl-tRNA synthetase